MEDHTAMEAYFEIADSGQKIPVSLPAENADAVGLVTIPVPVIDKAFSPSSRDRAIAAVEATRYAAENLQTHTGLRVAVP